MSKKPSEAKPVVLNRTNLGPVSEVEASMAASMLVRHALGNRLESTEYEMGVQLSPTTLVGYQVLVRVVSLNGERIREDVE